MAQAYQIIARMYRLRIFQATVGPRIISAFMSDLQGVLDANNVPVGLSQQNILCPPGSGPPGAGTLLAGFMNYLPGDWYFDLNGKQAYVCVTAGTNATSTWQAIGSAGGTSGQQQFKLSYDAGDYWVAFTWDGTNQGTIPYSIVKPFELRCGTNAMTTQTFPVAGQTGSVTYEYSYSQLGTAKNPGAYYQRSSSGTDGSAATELMTPPPVPGSIIYASGCTTNILNGIPVPAIAVSIIAAGTGYAAGEILTVAAPTGAGGTPAQITANTVGPNGNILTCSLTANGAYTTTVTNPVLAAGSQGTGATFNLTLAPQLIDTNNNGRYWSDE
jgi:hypothetical protein